MRHKYMLRQSGHKIPSGFKNNVRQSRVEMPTNLGRLLKFLDTALATCGVADRMSLNQEAPGKSATGQPLESRRLGAHQQNQFVRSLPRLSIVIVSAERAEARLDPVILYVKPSL